MFNTETFLVALGLAADACAVSISCGCILNEKKRHALLMPVFFGLFQGLMPVLGWFAGRELKPFIERFDHWIAFLLLFLVGAKMAADSFQKNDCFNPFLIKNILLLAIATSIDALVVGFGYSLIQRPISMPALMIGVITFILSYAGLILGKKCSSLLGNKVRFAGGLIIMSIGIKILLEHILS